MKKKVVLPRFWDQDIRLAPDGVCAAQKGRSSPKWFWVLDKWSNVISGERFGLIDLTSYNTWNFEHLWATN